MPVITRFYGLIIKMYFMQREHNPPHFHVIYGEYIGLIDIRKLELIEGDLPNKALNLVLEWTEIYKEQLLKMWNTQNFIKLPPLK